MPSLPDIMPFAGLLAEIALELRRGNSCLVMADKGWTHLFCNDLRDRLNAMNLRCEFVNGRQAPNADPNDDTGVMLTAIRQVRRIVRGDTDGVVIVLPHLDIMATDQGGWTTVSRELVPLLYENPSAVLLGFRDPTLPLLPVAEKLFPRRFTVELPYRESRNFATGEKSDLEAR